MDSRTIGSQPATALLSRWPLVLAAVVLLGGTVAVIASTRAKPSEDEKNYARSAARFEMLRLHWQALETFTEFRSVIDALGRDLEVGRVEDDWAMKTIQRWSQPVKELSRFESDALERLAAGETEGWEHSGGKITRYVAAIRVGKNCINCHATNEDKQPMKVNDVISVVCFERIPRRKPGGE